MKNRRFKIFFLVLGTTTVMQQGFAQTKQTEQIEQVWVGYNNQTRISKKWGGWFDFQTRTRKHFVKDIAQMMFSPGITYYIKEESKVTAGYTYVLNFAEDPDKQKAQPEHRPWQQLQWLTKYSKVRTLQRVRLEERFRKNSPSDTSLVKAYRFNFRFRYSFLLQIPLSHKAPVAGDVSLLLNDELQMNFGKEIVYNYFDQNRFFAGFAYHVNNHDQLQLGYVNVFQQLSDGNKYRFTHVARVVYFHNIDLTRKNNKS